MFFRKIKEPAAPIVHAGDDDFDLLLAENPGVTIVDFWAPWCGPCRMMAPILDEIAIDHQERGVRVMKVNTDQAPETAGRFEIRSIPTLVFFRKGEPEFEMVGLVSKPVLEREIEGLLAQDST